jgi:hypothetical protein
MCLVVAVVRIRADRIGDLVPTEMAVDSRSSPRLASVFPQGGRGGRAALTIAVGHRTAFRMRAYEMLMTVGRRIVTAITGILVVLALWFSVLSDSASDWLGLAFIVLASSTIVLFVVVQWIVRAPQHPINMGDGWVVLRRVDPAAAREWQERNPNAEVVVHED